MNKLRSDCLNFKELLAQNIALISPTMTAALIVPLMYGTTGSISWLSYAVGAVLVRAGEDHAGQLLIRVRRGRSRRHQNVHDNCVFA